jgi:hypothetical protein
MSTDGDTSHWLMTPCGALVDKKSTPINPALLPLLV